MTQQASETKHLTAPEAVERLAAQWASQCDCNIETTPCMAEDGCRLELNTAATLRALSSALEVTKAERDKYFRAYSLVSDECEEEYNRAATADAKLKEAVRMGKTMSRFISGDPTQRGVHAAHEFRAFLASIEGDKP